ncbi:hypothetical protein GMD88_17815 [Pseudoflavonifractor sp. BIOML-A6]|nr:MULTISPECIES: hypothetical protein [unclassified Pseudoflavonifractor]MTQ98636.1 hypothetical protein [Pseudoflavonifractor sp. BIOML-A16]MTR07934.1 hypothetical protein [Pseudoflavonifractor sp. BIOML-A15]MTR34101.1 hypothetical protein [Pseudoflavonifractor sp. BIOML-A14]MTR74871.1 hypothetical protein [Pseudoflavonifractor sp. BIOML-A18]MTS66098.1 hypothetical protein [Pseudoflavonifractor sp. BIOML-A5]MTS73490.1 hypothetical protein [Pseudoflavonifractor sp. BIOML-A8]MTS92656.1 hypoth
MSKPRYKWWGYVKNVIRDYPRLKRWHDELMGETTLTAAYGSTGGGRPSEVSNPTYQVATREMPKQEQREYEAVRRAIEATERKHDGKVRLDVIRMVCWEQTHTLSGAALAAPMSYRTARRIQSEFAVSVARGLGFL